MGEGRRGRRRDEEEERVEEGMGRKNIVIHNSIRYNM